MMIVDPVVTRPLLREWDDIRTSIGAVIDPARQAGEEADIEALDERIASFDRRLAALHKENPVGQLLVTIPGIGSVAAMAMATGVDPARFTSGRAFAAFLGLTPRITPVAANIA